MRCVVEREIPSLSVYVARCTAEPLVPQKRLPPPLKAFLSISAGTVKGITTNPPASLVTAVKK